MDGLILRDVFGPVSTLSRFYLDYRKGAGWQYFGAAIEDRDRGLVVGLTSAERNRVFVLEQTAISATEDGPPYVLGLHDSDKHGPEALHVLDVPGNTWILMHPGINQDSSAGCICPGLRRDVPNMRLVPGTSGPAVDFLRRLWVPLIKAAARGEIPPCTLAVRRVPGAMTLGRVPHWNAPTATS